MPASKNAARLGGVLLGRLKPSKLLLPPENKASGDSQASKSQAGRLGHCDDKELIATSVPSRQINGASPVEAASPVAAQIALRSS
mgnify:CR=1 FL=1